VCNLRLRASMTLRGGAASVLISNFFCEKVLRDRDPQPLLRPPLRTSCPPLVRRVGNGHPRVGNGNASGNAPQLRLVKSNCSSVLMAAFSREPAPVLWLCIVTASSFSANYTHTLPQATSLSALRDIHHERSFPMMITSVATVGSVSGGGPLVPLRWHTFGSRAKVAR
jgi:hypothetical protein